MDFQLRFGTLLGWMTVLDAFENTVRSRKSRPSSHLTLLSVIPCEVELCGATEKLGHYTKGVNTGYL